MTERRSQIEPAEASFEVRGLRLYLDGEPVPVDPNTVRLALHFVQRRDGGTIGMVSRSFAEAILSLERERSLYLLAEELLRMDRARVA